MNFRKADKNDIQQLVKYRMRQLADEGASPVYDISHELSDYFTSHISDGSFISWLAVDGEEIVATSGICFYQLLPTYSNPTGRVAYVTNMYTLPEYRRCGIASHLLHLVVDEAHKHGYKLIRLHASAAGKSIYRKRGFTDTGDFMSMML
ncbi:MAG: GNAT family N-acetyltransferase [Oscillospiraceae bacterium]|jgi:GNAT superfamily N-acetyltransferase|nr:GNAT family N-acetyltransferase [Oscillospiraceae bacterium]